MKWAGLVVLPVLLGAAAYLLWRPQDILAFDWAAALRLGPVINSARAVVGPPPSSLPHAILYTGPNACWTFSFVMAVGLIWRGKKSWERLVWLSVPVLIAVGAEVGQAAGLVPGTYTWADLIGTVTAVAAGLLVAQRLGTIEGVAA